MNENKVYHIEPIPILHADSSVPSLENKECFVTLNKVKGLQRL